MTVNGQIMVIGGLHADYRHILNKTSLISKNYRPVNEPTVVQCPVSKYLKYKKAEIKMSKSGIRKLVAGQPAQRKKTDSQWTTRALQSGFYNDRQKNHTLKGTHF